MLSFCMYLFTPWIQEVSSYLNLTIRSHGLIQYKYFLIIWSLDYYMFYFLYSSTLNIDINQVYDSDSFL